MRLTTFSQIVRPILGVLVSLAPLFGALGANLRIGVPLSAPFQLRAGVESVSLPLLDTVSFALPSFRLDTSRGSLSTSPATDLANFVETAVMSSDRMTVVTEQLYAARSAHVLFMRNRFKVLGIDAASDSTFVIQFRGISGDLSDESKVGKHVGQLDMLNLMGLPIRNAIAASVEASNPKPTSTIRLRDAVFNNAFCGGFRQRRDVWRKSALMTIQTAHSLIILVALMADNTTLMRKVL